jgi:predicted nucleic acid-binding protein
VFSLLPASRFHEIVYGLELKNAVSQLNKAIEWLNQNEEITPTSADYATAAKVKAAARKSGYAVELPDCLIASVAARIGRPLITGNTEDFTAIQRAGLNLALENWRK